MKRDELAQRLKATFASEVEEQVRVANAHLLELESHPGNAEALRALFRVMHTLKGAARAAGVPELESLCHRLEDVLAELRDQGREPTRDEVAQLFEGLDRLEAGRRGIQGTTAGPSSTAPAAGGTSTGSGSADSPAGERAEPGTRVRVTAARIDELVAASSRLIIAARQTEVQPAALWRLQDAVARTSVQLRDATLRGGAVATDQPLWQTLRSAARELEQLALRAESATRELHTLAAELSTGVRELRMRPFADAVEPLPRLIRDLAAAAGKDVRLEVRGEAVAADRVVLGEIGEALVHLIRNAVDHGIEPADERARQGKAAQGIVRVAAELVSDRLLVTVSDDGAGLDVQGLRAALERAGHPVPADDQEVARAAFSSGVSTRAEASEISGRGVGLDAARAAMARVRGGMDVTWTPGGGTTFVLDAPLTLAGIRAVSAAIGGQLVALPSAFIDRLVRVATEDVKRVEGRDAILTDDGPVPVVRLAELLGPPFRAEADGRFVRAMLLHAGETRAAVAVDELLAEEELLVRPLPGRAGEGTRHIAGAALLPSGRVALMLNAGSLVRAAVREGGRTPFAAATARAPVRRHRILVVDDSLTTRALEESLLDAAGYDVATAVDGAEAWALLQERGADLVVTDIEMPRMDGFELCEAVRASPRFRDLPVVLVTALESAEHRARGLEVRADAYLPKSSFDQETLLETIHQLLG